jgi:predicted Zn-ribbon and HTH transcriptional regulator
VKFARMIISRLFQVFKLIGLIKMQKITDHFENGVFKYRTIVTTQDGRHFICNSCKYLWETRKKLGDPPKCPKCNSKDIEEYSPKIQDKIKSKN